MEVGSKEAARRMGMSERRVQFLARAGRIPARQVGRTWLIDPSHLDGARKRSRPMSARTATAMISLLSDPLARATSLGISPREASRLRARLGALREDDDPGAALAAWMSARPEPLRLCAHPDDLPLVLADARFVRSGISDPRASLSAVDEIEGWVRAGDVAALLRDHMLVDVGRGNCIVHVSSEALPRPTPLGVMLADLSAHPEPRARSAVRRLVRQALA